MWAILLSLWLLFPVSALAVELTIFDPIILDTNISVTASLSATSNYYLQGVIRSTSSSKYYGETQNNSNNWIDYISSPEKEYITSNFFVTTVENASWSGNLNMRFKLDDPNYLGPGSYEIKLRRFTGNSTSPAGESNTLLVNLTTATPTPTPSPTPTPTPTPSTTPTPSPSPSHTPSLSPLPSPTRTLASPPIGTVAGEMIEINLTGFGVATPAVTPSPTPASTLTLNSSRAKNVVLMGSGLVTISLAGYLGMRKYRNQHIIIK